MTRPRLTYVSILLGALLWCTAILLAPVFAAAGGFPARGASYVYQFFQPLCHQIDERTFHLFGAPLAVCIRCSAIYFAFLGGTLLYPVIRSVNRAVLPHRRWLVLAALPMLLDVAAGVAGFHESTLVSRSVTGALIGMVLPFYIIPAAVEAVLGFTQPRDTIPLERKDP